MFLVQPQYYHIAVLPIYMHAIRKYNALQFTLRQKSHRCLTLFGVANNKEISSFATSTIG